MKPKVKKALVIAGISVGGVLALTLTFVGGFLIYASSTTLQVKPEAKVEVVDRASAKVNPASDMRIVTWNMGYGALDEKADFYMDGGKTVNGESVTTIYRNTYAIMNEIETLNPDVFFIQEVDIHSQRSYYVQERDMFLRNFPEYDNSYACNFKAGFIPIPIGDPMGTVEAGITSFSKFDVIDASRQQLPIPFSWPISLFNLKRCLLVNRSPIEGSDKELVTVNLHLEAYDDGEGKAKQLAQLMGFLQAEYNKGNYVIAGGDFNQTFSNVDLTKYPKMNDWVCPIIDVTKYSDFTFSMDDTIPTCRSLNKPYFDSDKATHQYYMLDGFITSNNIEVKGIETLDLGFKNTDHNPVMMNIKLK